MTVGALYTYTPLYAHLQSKLSLNRINCGGLAVCTFGIYTIHHIYIINNSTPLFIFCPLILDSAQEAKNKIEDKQRVKSSELGKKGQTIKPK